MHQTYILLICIFALAGMDVVKQRKEEVKKLRRIARDVDVERCADNANKEAVKIMAIAILEASLDDEARDPRREPDNSCMLRCENSSKMRGFCAFEVLVQANLNGF